MTRIERLLDKFSELHDEERFKSYIEEGENFQEV